MNITSHAPLTPDGRAAVFDPAPAVSWGAVFAGAAGAAALSLILLVLGGGLGFTVVSPWANNGVEAETFGIASIAWMAFTSIAASAVGGYLAGRLRTRWTATGLDEVYFRDTAHGFLAWGIATLATAALLSSVIASVVGGGAQAVSKAGGALAMAGAAAAGTAAPQVLNQGMNPTQLATGYSVDTLFRRDAAGASTAAATSTPGATPGAMPGAMTMPSDGTASTGPAPTAEVGRIFTSGLRSGAALPAEDVRYIGQLVAQRAGIPQADAEKRVTDAYARLQTQLRDAETKAREAADKARKAAAYAALWTFVALLAGAFFASFAATVGGRQRDL